MTPPPKRPGTISRERILQSGKVRCHRCGRETKSRNASYAPTCRACKRVTGG